MRRMWERLSHHTSVRVSDTAATASCTCGWYDTAQLSEFSLTVSKTKKDKASAVVSEAAEFHWRTVGI